MGSPAPAPTAISAGARPTRRKWLFVRSTGSDASVPTAAPPGRGLLSSSFRLSISVFCGIGGAFRGSLGGLLGVLVDIKGCLRCLLCQELPRLSWTVDECKPCR